MREYSWKRRAVAILISAAAGYLCRWGLGLYASAAIPVMYAFAGWTGAAAMGVAATAGAAALHGAQALPAILLALIAPGYLVIWLLRSKKPYGAAVRLAIAGSLLLTALGLLIVRLQVGRDLIEWQLDEMEAAFRSLPFTVRVRLYSSLGLGLGGSGLMAPDQQEEYIRTVRSLLGQTLYPRLPAMVAMNAVSRALWGYGLSMRLLSKGDEAARQRDLRLHEWRLPRDVLIGLPVVTAALWLMNGAKVFEGSDSVLTVFLNLTLMAYSIQGLAAFGRVLVRGQATDRRRHTTYGMLVILCMISQMGEILLCLLGVGSALFGSEGLFRNRSEE